MDSKDTYAIIKSSLVPVLVSLIQEAESGGYLHTNTRHLADCSTVIQIQSVKLMPSVVVAVVVLPDDPDHYITSYTDDDLGLNVKLVVEKVLLGQSLVTALEK